MVQQNMVQSMLSIPKSAPVLGPFPPASVQLQLLGPIDGRVVSAIRRVVSGRLTLRLRYDADVTVEVWRRALTQWEVTTYQGHALQHLLPRTSGEEFQLQVEGVATGVAELVDEGR
jgi:hypothetical protein